MALAKARRDVAALLPKNAIGAEIGVWKGEFSAELISVATPKKLVLIDPWVIQDDPAHSESWYGDSARADMEAVHDGVKQRFEKELTAGSVEIRRAFSGVALAEFPNEYFHFIYIDGDHSYAGVREDCFAAYDKVRVGGYICGDDYALGGWWKDGVVRAFHELLYERSCIIKFALGNQVVVQKISNSAS